MIANLARGCPDSVPTWQADNSSKERVAASQLLSPLPGAIAECSVSRECGSVFLQEERQSAQRFVGMHRMQRLSDCTCARQQKSKLRCFKFYSGCSILGSYVKIL